MQLTTLIYIENDGTYLMLHRIKKVHDLNANKWVGLGGKVETNESPLECALREVKEEANISLDTIECKGIITFILPKWGNECCFLYKATTHQQSLINCNEGELHWIDKSNILQLNLWEGDHYFLKPLLNDEGFNEYKLVYDNNDRLVEVWINKENIK